MFKLLGHLAYMIISLYPTIYYPISGAFTKEWNPLKQPKARRQYIQSREKEAQKQENLRLEQKQRYFDAYEKLFIEPAYANKDENKGISFKEKLDAWDRMGLLPDRPVFYDESLKDPNFKDLEKAVKSYERE